MNAFKINIHISKILHIGNMDINFIITTLFFNKAYQYVILKTLYIIIIHNGIQNFSAWHLYSEF